jgi:hypothetical protein
MLVLSCDTLEICDDSGESVLVARFKIQGDELNSDTIISSFSLFGIREGKADSLLYDSTSSSASRVELPLDPHHDFSRFVLQIDELSDTLYIGHTTGYYLMSYTCGYAALFTLDPDKLHHGNSMIRGFEIIEAVIDAEQLQDEEHLWLYF